jgi:hypothetical protein
MRRLATIQKIVDIQPIKGADKIEVATILGWQVVVAKKDGFKVGDLIVYCEIDSILPDKPEFEFLRERKFRIKTIKLKGQVSQGICFPLSILPRGKYQEDDDVTEIIGVKKYNPQAEAEQKLADERTARSKSKIEKFLMRRSWYRRLFLAKKVKRSFPSFIKKTDEERIQNMPWVLEKEKDTKFIVTEKLDGQSATYFLLRNPRRWQFWNKYIFGVCSRNIYLHQPDNSSYWTIARQYNIEKALRSIINGNICVILQGEIIGKGIQENKYGLDGYDFYAFNLFYDGCGFDTATIETLLKGYSIKTVPIIDIWYFIKNSIPEMVEYANCKSVIADTLREGIVCRNHEKGISFKVVSPEFLLKYGE